MSSKAAATKKADAAQAVVKREATISERFLADVERQFEAQMGAGITFSPLEKRLTQHMFLKLDQALKAAEARRKQGTEFSWKTIDRQQLALDTVHRVSLGLDALIPNHVHPVFYWNARKGLYEAVLLTGYAGLDHVARKFAAEPPLAIRYELVHETDHFRPLPRSSGREVEDYEFEITQPFDRGEIIGGFGYIEFEDPRKNRLVIVTPRDFQRAQAASKGGFWKDHEVEMHWKTVVRRVTGRIALDPEKVNAASLAAALADEADVNERVVVEVAEDARRRASTKTIDVPAPEPAPEPAPDPEPVDEPGEQLGDDEGDPGF